jgi:GDP-L-fucose synthase
VVQSQAYDLSGKRVWVAGHRGMVGSALLRRLASEKCELLTVTRDVLDLRKQADVEAWIETNKPDVIFLAAARVGGILANSMQPAQFIYDNLTIAGNVIKGAHQCGVEKLMFLGSGCVYPRDCKQPMRETDLMTGRFEPTNEPYAVAKLAGISLCQSYRKEYGSDFISVIPTGLYGPGDNFDLYAGHVIPSLINKISEAKLRGGPVEIWGSGAPRREFMFIDDAADAMVYLMKNWSSSEIINIGSGEDVSIRQLADELAGIIGYGGKFQYDGTKPDGMPRKLLDASRLSDLGWRSKTSLQAGLAATYRWYCAENGTAR